MAGQGSDHPAGRAGALGHRRGQRAWANPGRADRPRTALAPAGPRFGEVLPAQRRPQSPEGATGEANGQPASCRQVASSARRGCQTDSKLLVEPLSRFGVAAVEARGRELLEGSPAGWHAGREGFGSRPGDRNGGGSPDAGAHEPSPVSQPPRWVQTVAVSGCRPRERWFSSAVASGLRLARCCGRGLPGRQTGARQWVDVGPALRRGAGGGSRRVSPEGREVRSRRRSADFGPGGAGGQYHPGGAKGTPDGRRTNTSVFSATGRQRVPCRCATVRWCRGVRAPWREQRFVAADGGSREVSRADGLRTTRADWHSSEAAGGGAADSVASAVGFGSRRR